MKNIIFNGMILDEKPTGLGVFTDNILKNIDKNNVKCIVSQKDLDYGIDNRVICIDSKNKFKKIFLRNYKFKKNIKEIITEDSIIFSPTQHGIIDKNIRQIITIHDLIPLMYPGGRFHQYIYYKYILPRVIKHCEKIVTVSDHTRKDLIKFYNIPEDKIEVIYNGYNKPKKVDIKESKDYIKEKYKLEDYILMVGINYEYKNLHSIISAYSKSNIKDPIVIVGNHEVEYGAYLKKLVNEYNLNDKVIFLGYVSEEDKEKLYQASKVFVFPSLYEGFGLPVLEAMANNTPVLLSNSSSLPEVGGDAAIYFDASDDNDILEKLEYMTSLDEEKREEIIKRGLENVNRFSWEKCGEKLSELLKNV